jgi:predicted nuclease of predicted toxin-antitoxin system
MRFIVDAQLPPALAVWLRERGHDAKPLRDIGLLYADDLDIWGHARREGAIVVTKDEDFSQLVVSNAEGPTVLWIRTGNLLKRALLARFEVAWPEVERHLLSGVRLVELR